MTAQGVAGWRPSIVGIGGTTRAGSTSERVLRYCLDQAARQGARTTLFSAAELTLPMYAPEQPHRPEAAVRLIRAIETADGLVICSPGYHGGVSGLIKNALDYIEDLREAEAPYLDGRAVGCIACATGWQAAMTTLTSLRAIVHALRGWPTPLGVAVNTSNASFAADGSALDEKVAAKVTSVAHQVVGFALTRRPAPAYAGH